MFNPFVFMWFIMQLMSEFFTIKRAKEMQYIALIDSSIMDTLFPLQSNSSPYYLHTTRLTYNLREQVKQNPNRREQFLTWKQNNDMLFNVRMVS